MPPKLRGSSAILVVIMTLCSVAAVASAAPAQKSRSRFRTNNKLAPTAPKDANIVREDGKMVIYKKKTTVDFDDSLIEGEVRNPSEFYFVHRPEEKFGTLVKKRKNFHKEMLRDSVMIR